MTKITTKGFLNDMGGEVAKLFTLTNENNMKVSITNFGGIITNIILNDKNGNETDVTLGFDTQDGYLNTTGFIGAVIGRYANRINKGEANLNGSILKLNKNDKNNHLHGGNVGFDKKTFEYTVVSTECGEGLLLTLKSQDNDENFPGELNVQVLYTLDNQNNIGIEYNAKTTKTTIINLTNHAYFNLKGHDKGDVLSHELTLNSLFYTPINEESIPTGEILSVVNTPFDFTKTKKIGKDINDSNINIKNGNGYDHNFVINKKYSDKTLELAALVYEEETGIVLESYTNKPGVQLYTGNFLNEDYVGKNNTVYHKRSGFCLETQFFPNSPNYSHFSNCVLNPLEEYNYKTVYRFYVKN